MSTYALVWLLIVTVAAVAFFLIYLNKHSKQ